MLQENSWDGCRALDFKFELERRHCESVFVRPTWREGKEGMALAKSVTKGILSRQSPDRKFRENPKAFYRRLSTRRSSQRFLKSIWFPFSSVNPHSKSSKHVGIYPLRDVPQKDHRSYIYSSRHVMFLIDVMSLVCLFLATRTHIFRRLSQCSDAPP